MAEIAITPLGAGAYRISEGLRTRVAYAAGSADARWVFFEGRVYVVGVAQPFSAARGRRTHDEGALASPMPATVVSITVAPGERVSKGDVLVMLEAMKMELPIKAPRDGTVKTISCRPGELVQPGLALVELE